MVQSQIALASFPEAGGRPRIVHNQLANRAHVGCHTMIMITSSNCCCTQPVVCEKGTAQTESRDG